MFSLFPIEEKVYLSFDTLYLANPII